MHRCSIVPPHILAALTRSDDERVAGCARRTIDLDVHLREGRVARTEREGLSEGLSPSGEVAPRRSVHDAQHLEQLPGQLVRSEGQPDSGDVAVDEAYDGLGHTWQLWWDVYGRNSLDGAGLPLVATVHYGQDYVNAFWDGDQMVFGDGDGEIFHRFTSSLDVIGHELAHGVTQYTSRLAYRGQPGALNEHVSDVFGVLVKQHLLGQEAAEADWLIGAELLAEGVRGRGLRSMAAPGTAYDDPRLGKDPQPAHMRDYVETTDDNGGVHINSGIPNKAFHLVATSIGGAAWEAPGQVWFDVITGEIPPECDFVTFADLTTEAARARFGEGSDEARAVASAWAEVGVTKDAAGGQAPPAPTGVPSRGGSAEGALVRLTRSGGVTGMTRSREVDLTQLPEQDATAFRALLTGPEITRWAQEETRPDAFSYGVSCDRPAVDVQLPEPALPKEVRDLLERALHGWR